MVEFAKEADDEVRCTTEKYGLISGLMAPLQHLNWNNLMAEYKLRVMHMKMELERSINSLEEKFESLFEFHQPATAAEPPVSNKMVSSFNVLVSLQGRQFSGVHRDPTLMRAKQSLSSRRSDFSIFQKIRIKDRPRVILYVYPENPINITIITEQSNFYISGEINERLSNLNIEVQSYEDIYSASTKLPLNICHWYCVSQLNSFNSPTNGRVLHHSLESLLKWFMLHYSNEIGEGVVLVATKLINVDDMLTSWYVSQSTAAFYDINPKLDSSTEHLFVNLFNMKLGRLYRAIAQGMHIWQVQLYDFKTNSVGNVADGLFQLKFTIVFTAVLLIVLQKSSCFVGTKTDHVVSCVRKASNSINLQIFGSDAHIVGSVITTLLFYVYTAIIKDLTMTVIPITLMFHICYNFLQILVGATLMILFLYLITLLQSKCVSCEGSDIIRSDTKIIFLCDKSSKEYLLSSSHHHNSCVVAKAELSSFSYNYPTSLYPLLSAKREVLWLRKVKTL